MNHPCGPLGHMQHISWKLAKLIEILGYKDTQINKQINKETNRETLFHNITIFIDMTHPARKGRICL